MTKVISLSNPAYEKLKGLKQGQESFSDVVLRLAEKGKKQSLLKFAGLWRDIPEMDRIFEGVIKNMGKSSDRNLDLKW